MRRVSSDDSNGTERCPETRSELVARLLTEYQHNGTIALREQLVELHLNLVAYLAQKFANRGEPVEDLKQVGYIALLKAIERFDPSNGARFSTFATPTIIGEIKRYFRDKGWLLKVPRRLQERRILVNRAVECLSSSLGRPPKISEIAAATQMTEEDVIEAQEAAEAYSVQSLDDLFTTGESDRGASIADSLGENDRAYRSVDERLFLRRSMEVLDDRSRLIVYLTFFQNKTQGYLAAIIGVSQMQVSRLLKKALEKLKACAEQQTEQTA